jgi:hypothetical protein
MKPVKSTAEILAFKALNRDVDKTWVDWAVDMLIAGFDTEHLTILAGESEPFNQFQMQELAEKVLVELQLDYSDNSENQWYWDGATRENIEKIITDYFTAWKTNCLTDERTTTA